MGLYISRKHIKFLQGKSNLFSLFKIARMRCWARKVVGALKDAITVGFALMSYVGLVNTTPAINTRLADIDVAFVKVARHNGKPPKEKHVLILVAATQEKGLRPYIKQVVEDRLSRTKNWMVAVKTLALIHRLIRDDLPCNFAQQDQENQSSSDATPLVEVSQSFEDRSTPLALQFSLWVRKYASFLAQRLQCNCKIYYLTLAEYQNFEIAKLLEDLLSLHLLLGRLLDCTPQEGPVAVNCLIHYTLDLFMKDCPKICTAINHCLHKLLDYSFSDFSSDQALRLLYFYEQIFQQYDQLSDFYSACTRVGLTDGHGDYLSQKRFLSEMRDRIQKHRQHCTGLVEEHITKKETAPKETLQDAVEEERPLITWRDSDYDGANYGSKNTDQEASYESNLAVKAWEREFERRIKDSFTNYHAEIGWDRALGVDSSSTTSYHAEKKWERALDMSTVDSSSTTNYGTQIELSLQNGHRTNLLS